MRSGTHTGDTQKDPADEAQDVIVDVGGPPHDDDNDDDEGDDDDDDNGGGDDDDDDNVDAFD